MARNGLVAPLIECTVPVEETAPELEPLRARLAGVVDARKRAGQLEAMGVYVRLLDLGLATSVDADAVFRPLSLAQLPTALALHRLAIAEPGLMSRPIVPPPQSAPAALATHPATPLEPGRAYPVAELMRLSLTESNRHAHAALKTVVPPDALNGVYRDVGLVRPESCDTTSVSVRAYALFFRGLYNGSLVSPDAAAKLLETMTRSTFDAGLQAGVPGHVKVAHRFGELWTTDPATGAKTMNLHDCGIVYQPGQPFLLCVMATGQSPDDIAASIAEVARIAYDDLAKRPARQTAGPP